GLNAQDVKQKTDEYHAFIKNVREYWRNVFMMNNLKQNEGCGLGAYKLITEPDLLGKQPNMKLKDIFYDENMTVVFAELVREMRDGCENGRMLSYNTGAFGKFEALLRETYEEGTSKRNDKSQSELSNAIIALRARSAKAWKDLRRREGMIEKKEFIDMFGEERGKVIFEKTVKNAIGPGAPSANDGFFDKDWIKLNVMDKKVVDKKWKEVITGAGLTAEEEGKLRAIFDALVRDSFRNGNSFDGNCGFFNISLLPCFAPFMDYLREILGRSPGVLEAEAAQGKHKGWWNFMSRIGRLFIGLNPIIAVLLIIPGVEKTAFGKKLSFTYEHFLGIRSRGYRKLVYALMIAVTIGSGVGLAVTGQVGILVFGLGISTVTIPTLFSYMTVRGERTLWTVISAGLSGLLGGLTWLFFGKYYAVAWLSFGTANTVVLLVMLVLLSALSLTQAVRSAKAYYNYRHNLWSKSILSRSNILLSTIFPVIWLILWVPTTLHLLPRKWLDAFDRSDRQLFRRTVKENQDVENRFGYIMPQNVLYVEHIESVAGYLYQIQRIDLRERDLIIRAAYLGQPLPYLKTEQAREYMYMNMVSPAYRRAEMDAFSRHKQMCTHVQSYNEIAGHTIEQFGRMGTMSFILDQLEEKEIAKIIDRIARLQEDTWVNRFKLIARVMTLIKEDPMSLNDLEGKLNNQFNDMNKDVKATLIKEIMKYLRDLSAIHGGLESSMFSFLARTHPAEYGNVLKQLRQKGFGALAKALEMVDDTTDILEILKEHEDSDHQAVVEASRLMGIMLDELDASNMAVLDGFARDVTAVHLAAAFSDGNIRYRHAVQLADAKFGSLQKAHDEWKKRTNWPADSLEKTLVDLFPEYDRVVKLKIFQMLQMTSMWQHPDPNKSIIRRITEKELKDLGVDVSLIWGISTFGAKIKSGTQGLILEKKQIIGLKLKESSSNEEDKEAWQKISKMLIDEKLAKYEEKDKDKEKEKVLFEKDLLKKKKEIRNALKKLYLTDSLVEEQKRFDAVWKLLIGIVTDSSFCNHMESKLGKDFLSERMARGIINKKEIEKNKLDSEEVFKKLIENNWAKKRRGIVVVDGEFNLKEEKNRIEKVFGQNSEIVCQILEKAKSNYYSRFLFNSRKEFADLMLGFRDDNYGLFLENPDGVYQQLVEFANVFRTAHTSNAEIPIYKGDEILSTLKNGGIGMNVWLTTGLSSNQDALVRVMPGANPYRLNTAAYMGRNPEVVVMNPAFLIWGASGEAYPGRRRYKMMQQTFTQTTQLGFQDLTLFYGKGIVNPAAGDTLLMTPVEDSGAFMIQKDIEPDAMATCEGAMVWEWARPSLHVESVIPTETRYVFNVALLIQPSSMFRAFTNKFVGVDFKLNVLQNAFHYLSAPFALTVMMALPFLQPFSGFAYLQPLVFFLALTVFMMNAVNLANLLRHLFLSGNLYKSLAHFLNDIKGAFPYCVTMIEAFFESAIKVANEVFSFIPTQKNPIFGRNDWRTRFMTLRLFKFMAHFDGRAESRSLRFGFALVGIGIVGSILRIVSNYAWGAGIGLASVSSGYIFGYALVLGLVSLAMNRIIRKINDKDCVGVPLTGIISVVGIIGFMVTATFTTPFGIVFTSLYFLAIIAFLTGTNVFDTFVEVKNGKRQLIGWRLSEMFGRRWAFWTWAVSTTALVGIVLAGTLPVWTVAAAWVLAGVSVVSGWYGFENVREVLKWNLMFFAEMLKHKVKAPTITDPKKEKIKGDWLAKKLERINDWYWERKDANMPAPARADDIYMTRLMQEILDGLTFLAPPVEEKDKIVITIANRKVPDAFQADVTRELESRIIVKVVNAAGETRIVPVSDIIVRFASIHLEIRRSVFRVGEALSKLMMGGKTVDLEALCKSAGQPRQTAGETLQAKQAEAAAKVQPQVPAHAEETPKSEILPSDEKRQSQKAGRMEKIQPEEKEIKELPTSAIESPKEPKAGIRPTAPVRLSFRNVLMVLVEFMVVAAMVGTLAAGLIMDSSAIMFAGIVLVMGVAVVVMAVFVIGKVYRRGNDARAKRSATAVKEAPATEKVVGRQRAAKVQRKEQKATQSVSLHRSAAPSFRTLLGAASMMVIVAAIAFTVAGVIIEDMVIMMMGMTVIGAVLMIGVTGIVIARRQARRMNRARPVSSPLSARASENKTDIEDETFENAGPARRQKRRVRETTPAPAAKKSLTWFLLKLSGFMFFLGVAMFDRAVQDIGVYGMIIFGIVALWRPVVDSAVAMMKRNRNNGAANNNSVQSLKDDQLEDDNSSDRSGKMNVFAPPAFLMIGYGVFFTQPAVVAVGLLSIFAMVAYFALLKPFRAMAAGIHESQFRAVDTAKLLQQVDQARDNAEKSIREAREQQDSAMLASQQPRRVFNFVPKSNRQARLRMLVENPDRFASLKNKAIAIVLIFEAGFFTAAPALLLPSLVVSSLIIGTFVASLSYAKYMKSLRDHANVNAFARTSASRAMKIKGDRYEYMTRTVLGLLLMIFGTVAAPRTSVFAALQEQKVPAAVVKVEA
ncbi:MAG TPA: hypothetical protein VLJ10_03120, partial [Candidatus Bathyarchaeia archaeon]|nr:hypothetical protein [Candidatus Bathyarchaeia archaeon]